MPRLLAVVTWLALLCGASPAVQATDYYACDCAAGAAAACQVGDDGAAGTSPAAPWRSYGRARNAFATLQPGDAVRFCRGGAFPIAGPTTWVNASCTAATPCTIASYAPPWGLGDEHPRLLQTTGAGISFADGGAPDHEEGYVLRDLALTCSQCVRDDPGVFFFNDIDDVRLENLRVQGFGIGVYVGGSNACAVGDTCDRGNSRITLTGSVIRDSIFHGFLGGGDDLLIADSTFAGNGTGTILEHNIYVVGDFVRPRVIGNTLYRSAAVTSGRCQGASLVSHGRIDDFVVEGNYIHEDVGAAEGSCWGINLTPGNTSPERFLRAVVRNNTLHHVGTVAIALAACVDCLVENNVIVHAQPYAITAISAPASHFEGDDATMERLVVRNNSIYVETSNSAGIRIADEGTGHVVVANAMQSTATTGFWHCLALDLPPASYAAVDHNVCGYVPGPQREWERLSGSLAQWQGASGFDAGSLASAPGFVAPTATLPDLRATSAASAMVGRGDAARGAPDDIERLPRGPAPDAGAYQWRGPESVFANGFE